MRLIISLDLQSLALKSQDQVDSQLISDNLSGLSDQKDVTGLKMSVLNMLHIICNILVLSRIN